MTWLRCALIALAVNALVSPGNFGSTDTVYRLQVARWIRLGESPYIDSGLVGREGRRYPWYGIGQSLVLLPFDAISGATVAPVLARMGLDSSKVRQGADACTAFLMQWVLTTGVLAFAYRLLLGLGFTPAAGKAGSLALLFGTTCLEYVQCAQENLLLLLLALMALVAVRQWLREGGMVWSAAAGAACGFAMLVRLTSALEAAAILLIAIFWGAQPRRFLAGFLPPLVLAAIVDRCYQWYRFGDWFGTYMDVLARQSRSPDSPASFPFSYPFWKGFAGTLVAPDKSVFLFDPLLVVLLAVVIWRWRQLGRDLRVLLLGLTLLFFSYCAFYARWFVFGGDVAWGDRFMTLPVHLLCLLSVPLLMSRRLGTDTMFSAQFAGNVVSVPGFQKVLWSLVIASVALQAASTAISPQMEYQQKLTGYGNAVIWNRAVNLQQLVTGRQDPGRIQGIPVEWRSLYYLPFQLRFRFPALARWAIGAWLAVLVCLPWLLWTKREHANTALSGDTPVSS